MLKNFDKNRCYIIAEIGGNFTTFKEAKILVDLAYEAGVDAVKLQTYNADTIVTKTARFDLDVEPLERDASILVRDIEAPVNCRIMDRLDVAICGVIKAK